VPGTDQKKGRDHTVPPFLLSGYRALNCDDVLCLRAFLALRDSELNLLAFSQGLESVSRDVAEVSKYVRA